MKYNESIIIREYLSQQIKDAIMSLIKLNTPGNFFAEEEANDLSKYLDEEIEQYYVLPVDWRNQVGCGVNKFCRKNGTIGENKLGYDTSRLFKVNH